MTLTNPLGTIFSAQWANDVQDEITGVILEARLPLVAGSKHKMTEAIKIIASETVPAAERWASAAEAQMGLVEDKVVSPATIKRAVGSWNLNFKNKIINGGFDVWQRGESWSGTDNGNYITADRWKFEAGFAHGGTLSSSRSKNILLPNGDYVNTLNISLQNPSSRLWVSTTVENVLQSSGKTYTLSFYARADTPIDLDYILLFQRYNITDQSIVTPTQTASITQSWQRFSFVFSLPEIPSDANIEEDCNYFGVDIATQEGNIVPWDNVQFAQVQLEEGEIATEFEKRPLQVEELLCKRYYEVLGKTGSMFIPFIANGNASWASVQMYPKRTKNYSVSVVNSAEIFWLYGASAVQTSVAPSLHYCGYSHLALSHGVETVAGRASLAAYFNPIEIDAEL